MRNQAPFVALVCLSLAACQSRPKPGPTKPAPAATTPVATPEKWVRTELYFSLAPAEAEGLGLSAAEGTWRAFLDEEVTPRFPDGATVFDGYEQWRERDGAPVTRERSKVLVIVHVDTPAKRAGIEALRAAYLARTGEKRVRVIGTPVVTEPRF